MSAHSDDRMVVDLDRELDRLSALVRRVTTVLRAGPEGDESLPTPRELQRRMVLLDKLGARLDAASTILAGWWSHREWRDHFGHAGWPFRRERLTKALREDAEKGSREWLAHWAKAMAAGAFDEAERLCASDWMLAPRAAWWPERCYLAVDAFRCARRDPWQAKARFVDVPLWLLQEGRLPPGDQVALLIMGARVLALTGEPGAHDLLDKAMRIARQAPPAEELPARNAILAARSFVARKLIRADEDVRWLDRLRTAAVADLGCAVELLQRNRLSSAVASKQDSALGLEPVADTGALVASLPEVAGVAEALAVFIDDIPEELRLELAIRLQREGESQRAYDLVAELPASAGGTIDDRAEELRIQLAERGVPAGVDLADVLVSAAERASQRGRDKDAFAWFERALTSRPGDAWIARRLAETIIGLAGSSSPGKARWLLHRALALCDQADLWEPEPSASAASVHGRVHGALSALLIEGRTEHLWKSVEWAARAANLAPREANRWVELALCLLTVGAPHLADVMVRRAEGVETIAVEPEGSSAQVPAYFHYVRVAAAFGVGRPTEVLELLEVAPASDDVEISSWMHALKGGASRILGDTSTAEREFLTALQLFSDISIQREYAETLTLLGDERADNAWRTLWRDADVGTVDGLNGAAWAALYLGLPGSATELAQKSDRFTPGRTGDTEGPPVGQLIPALVAILEGRDEGWLGLLDSLRSISLAPMVRDMGRFYEAVTVRAATIANARGWRATPVDVDRLRRIVSQVAHEAEERWPADDLAAARAEVEWLAGRSSSPAFVTSALAAVTLVLDVPEAPAPVAEETAKSEPERGDDFAEPPATLTVRIQVPPHWFAGFEGRELEHEIFRRSLPDARAAARLRLGEEPKVWVRVHVDEGLPDDGVAVEFPGQERLQLAIRRGAWFARSSVLPALSGDAQAAVRRIADEKSLSEVPAPQDLQGRLAMWSAEDIVARFAIDGMVGSSGPAGSTLS